MEQGVKREDPPSNGAPQASNLATIIEQEIQNRVTEMVRQARKDARRAKRELSKAKEEREEQWTKIRAVRTKLRLAKEELKKTQEEKTGQFEEMRGVKRDLRLARKELQTIRPERADMERDLGLARQERADMEGELRLAREELRVAEANLAGANAQRNDDKRRIEWFAGRERQHSDEVVALASGNQRQLEEVRKRATEAREALEARLKETETMLALTRDSHHAAFSNKRGEYAEALKKQEEKHAAEIAAIKAAHAAEAERLKKQEERHAAEIAAIKAAHEDTIAAIAVKLEELKAAHAAQIAFIRTQQEEKVAAADAKLEELKAERAGLEELKAEREQLKTERAELERKLSILDDLHAQREAALKGQLDQESAEVQARTERFCRLIQGIPQAAEQCLAARSTGPMTMYLANCRPTPGEANRVREECEARIRDLVVRHEEELRAEVARHEETKCRLNHAEQARAMAERHSEQTYHMYMGTLNAVQRAPL